MESIFDPNANQKIIERINLLTPITLSQWGKMTVSQMMLHCQQPIKVAQGTLEIKPNWILSFLFGKSTKRKFMSSPAFGRGLPTVKEFKITYEPDFETSKKDLIELVNKFSSEGHSAVKVTKHPFFGPMTMEEIDVLQWKHLDHHLKQFGV